MAIGALTVTPSAATQAYAKVAAGDGEAAGAGSGSFGDALAGALNGVVQTGRNADALTAQGLDGHGNLTQIVTSVTQAQLALQTTVAIRDRMVEAYQSIMNMPI